jgi:hypothetical protein
MQRIRKILYISSTVFILLINAGLNDVFAASSDFQVAVRIINFDRSLLNKCDNHEWYPEPGLYGTEVTTTISYGSYHGRKSMQARFNVTGGNNWACIRTDHYFAPEVWNNVTLIGTEVYIESEDINAKHIEMQLLDIDGNKIKKPIATGIIKNSWQNVPWPVDLTSAAQVAQIILIPGNLQNGDVMYFSNMHITISAKDEIWETFGAPSYKWLGSEDFAPWHPVTSGYPRNEPISHKQTYNGSAGALYIPWDANQSSEHDTAKMEATDLYGADFTNFNTIKAWVWRSGNDADIYMGFWDGGEPKDTTAKTVSIGDWVQVVWNKPAGINWSGLRTFMFMIDTSGGGIGEFYIDEIEFVE